MAKTKHYKNNQMTMNSTLFSLYTFRIFIFLFTCLASIKPAASEEISSYTSGNFGLPGVIDIPTGYKLPDGPGVIRNNCIDHWHALVPRSNFFLILGLLSDTQGTDEMVVKHTAA